MPLYALCLPFRLIYAILSQCVMSDESFLIEPKHLDRCIVYNLIYSTTSSNCSITSSIHTSFSSLSSSSSTCSLRAVAAPPCGSRSGRTSAISSATRTCHAFHSSTALFRCATSSGTTSSDKSLTKRNLILPMFPLETKLLTS
ncbi:hypothetical protein EDB86DRAFT_417765 [Lactarius hatsudake]|nr:hypothetical protein EDB86DRAFT_417765 [Lactarius hatsudake]